MKLRLQYLLILTLVNLIIVALGLNLQFPGPEIAYEALNGDNPDIFLLDVDHRIKYNLTRHKAADSHPVWSPDGQYIAFESWRDGLRAIYVMDASGSNLRRLTGHSDGTEYDPRWTADGEAIIFRYYNRPESGLFRVQPDGSGLQKVTADAFTAQAAPDNHYVSLTYSGDGWQGLITEKQAPVYAADDIIQQEKLQWSADGHMIAFLSDYITAAPEVYLLDTTDNRVIQITNDGIPKSNLSWRP